MKSKILTFLIATLTFLSFSSIAKAETAPKSTINSPASTAVVEDKSQQTAEKSPESTAVTEDKTQPETADRNSNQAQEPVATKEVPSSSGYRTHKCGKQ